MLVLYSFVLNVKVDKNASLISSVHSTNLETWLRFQEVANETLHTSTMLSLWARIQRSTSAKVIMTYITAQVCVVHWKWKYALPYVVLLKGYKKKKNGGETPQAKCVFHALVTNMSFFRPVERQHTQNTFSFILVQIHVLEMFGKI